MSSAKCGAWSVNRQVLASVRDGVRSQLWPLPVAGVVLAVVAGVVMPWVDSRWGPRVPAWWGAVLFGGDAGAARTLLDAIASSLITVTSLTFSLTVVTLQLASSQFSPRLLRTFTSDVFVQATLAVFLATFTYALTVLRAVRSGDVAGGAFVPRISVTVAFVLGLASVLGLVLFLAHLARQIRVETMLRDVHDDASATIAAATRAREGTHNGNIPPALVPPTPPRDAVALVAPTSGFLTSVDEAQLRAAAINADAFVRIGCPPGSSLVAGVPIGAAWTERGPMAEDTLQQLRDAVDGAIRVGYERTAAQDVGYGLRQLTDVANKALSPGINDPTTAIHALGHVSALLCQLAHRELGPVLLSDNGNDGVGGNGGGGGGERVRVVMHRPDLADLLDGAISQPRRYGSSDPQVMARLFGLLEELAHHLDDQTPVLAQLGRLRATVARSDFDDTETGQLEWAARRVEHAVSHHLDASTRS